MHFYSIFAGILIGLALGHYGPVLLNKVRGGKA